VILHWLFRFNVVTLNDDVTPLRARCYALSRALNKS
jgi:hypothetical protein